MDSFPGQRNRLCKGPEVELWWWQVVKVVRLECFTRPCKLGTVNIALRAVGSH